MGGEHPALPYSSIRAMVSGIRGSAPAVHIKAFTASEIAHFAETERASVEDILRDLQAAGLDSLPGGGAEIFAERVREQVCPAKISGDRWLEVHQLAHSLGLRTNATMLYGHVETYADRVDHLLRLRAAQDVTGGFQAFIPLAFQPKNSALSHLPPTTGADDLKTLAVARLLLDNFAHIKTYWVMTGLKLAQVALFFGANDMDGTVVEEVISLMSGAGHGQSVAKSELVRVIRDTGRTPVERDALYRAVRRFDEPGGRGRAAAGRSSGGPAAARPGGAAMTVRVGHIGFLNCYPLYHGLEQRGILAQDRRRTGPAGRASSCCRECRPNSTAGWSQGDIDLGPISSIAYARNHRQLLLSRHVSISSLGAVDSIQLVTRKPLGRDRECGPHPAERHLGGPAQDDPQAPLRPGGGLRRTRGVRSRGAAGVRRGAAHRRSGAGGALLLPA